MEQKRTRSSKSSPSYFSEDFPTQEHKNKFNRYYDDRELHVSHYLDEEIFKNCSFMEAFNFVGLRNFVFEKTSREVPRIGKNVLCKSHLQRRYY